MTPRQKEALRRLARVDFAAFIQYTFPNYVWNWHHRVLVDHLQRWSDGEIPRLLLSIEARSGKSELVSRRLPAWLMGRDATTNFVSATYGQTLSDKLSRDTQRILRSAEFKEVFPEFDLDVAKTNTFETSEGGTYLATSVGGSVTGQGARYLSIDDPFKGREEAESPTIRRKTWEWFLNDAMTRLEHPASVLVTNTRWHTEDLQGMIQSSPGGEDWAVLNMKSIAEEPVPAWDPREPGQPIWPERYMGVLRGVTDYTYEEACEVALADYAKVCELDAYMFASMFQGEPTPKEGGLFKRAWFEKTYDPSPKAIGDMCDEVIISVDSSFAKGKKTDPVELLVLGRSGRYIYVLDEVNQRMDFPATLSAIGELLRRWPRAAVLIEAKANGQALVDTLRQEISGVIQFNPGTTSKDSRAHNATHRLEAGDVIFPLPVHAPWLSDFIEDFAGFGARAHDDRIDALSQACIFWNDRGAGTDRLRGANKGFRGLIERLTQERRYGRI